MAFIKSNNFAFEEKPKLTVASSEVDGKVNIPLVITKENGGYHGFIPGIVMKDIVCLTTQECEVKLKDFIKLYVKKAKQENLPYPFFPTNEEIKKDFKNVVVIKRLTTKAR